MNHQLPCTYLHEARAAQCSSWNSNFTIPIGQQRVYDKYSSSIYIDGVRQGKCWSALCNYARQRSPGDLAIVEGSERKDTGRLSLDLLLCCKVLEAFFFSFSFWAISRFSSSYVFVCTRFSAPCWVSCQVFDHEHSISYYLLPFSSTLLYQSYYTLVFPISW